MALHPDRVIRDLRELDGLTSTSDGAQRLAWTKCWIEARAWLNDKLSALPLELDTDEAGNQWATMRGARPESVVIGGHIDSVPNGGWLDGTLNLLAGVEVLRAFADHGTPPLTLKLVNWTDEEGVRFGYGLFGSSSAAGQLPVDELLHVQDKDGRLLSEVAAEHGVDLQKAPQARKRLRGTRAYLELHIEQGPVLERLNLPLGVVEGTTGIAIHRIRLVGETAHAGLLVRNLRRDTASAGASLVQRAYELAAEFDGVATVGEIALQPGIISAIAGRCELTLDQRHFQDRKLEQMIQQVKDAGADIAKAHDVSINWECIWRSAPVKFDDELIAVAEDVVNRLTANPAPRLTSGPLHDATMIASADIPTVMIFVQSCNGVSHSKEEDTKVEHLQLAVEALHVLTQKVMKLTTQGPRGC